MLRVHGERYVPHPSLAGVVQLRHQGEVRGLPDLRSVVGGARHHHAGGLGIQGGRNTLEAMIRNFCLVELIPWWLE